MRGDFARPRVPRSSQGGSLRIGRRTENNVDYGSGSSPAGRRLCMSSDILARLRGDYDGAEARATAGRMVGLS